MIKDEVFTKERFPDATSKGGCCSAIWNNWLVQEVFGCECCFKESGVEYPYPEADSWHGKVKSYEETDEYIVP